MILKMTRYVKIPMFEKTSASQTINSRYEISFLENLFLTLSLTTSKMSKNVRIKDRTADNVPKSKINKVKIDEAVSRLEDLKCAF